MVCLSYSIHRHGSSAGKGFDIVTLSLREVFVDITWVNKSGGEIEKGDKSTSLTRPETQNHLWKKVQWIGLEYPGRVSVGNPTGILDYTHWVGNCQPHFWKNISVFPLDISQPFAYNTIVENHRHHHTAAYLKEKSSAQIMGTLCYSHHRSGW